MRTSSVLLVARSTNRHKWYLNLWRYVYRLLSLWATGIRLHGIFRRQRALPISERCCINTDSILVRWNIRLHLALSHRVPDRTTPFPARDRLSYNRIPAGWSKWAAKAKPATSLADWAEKVATMLKRARQNSKTIATSVNLSERLRSNKTTLCVFWGRIWEISYRPPSSIGGLTSDCAGVDRSCW